MYIRSINKIRKKSKKLNKIKIPEQIIYYKEKELQKQNKQQLLLMDINKLTELTFMSARYLEDEILRDPRVRIHERRKRRKRWWLAQPTFKAIDEITAEW